MASWHRPGVLLDDYNAIVRLTHVLGGVVLWEFLSSFTYDWDVFRKRRPYRWTIWIHFFSRITCLLSVIFVIIHNDISRRSWCRTSSVLFLVFGSASIALASFIVILRIIAIWNRNIVVSVFSICMWLTSAALNLRVPFLTRSSWHVSVNACDIVTNGAFDVSVPMTLGSDVVLLLLMLVGLMRKPEARAQGICRFLYYQGVVWLSVAFVVEVPAMVLVLLDLDDPLNLMMQPVALVSLSICATRMYRSLSEYSSVAVYSSISGPMCFYHPAPSTEGE